MTDQEMLENPFMFESKQPPVLGLIVGKSFEEPDEDEMIQTDDNVCLQGYLADIDLNLNYDSKPVFLFLTENKEDDPKGIGVNVTLSDAAKEALDKLKLGKLYCIHGYAYRFRWQDKDDEPDTIEACEMFEIADKII